MRFHHANEQRTVIRLAARALCLARHEPGQPIVAAFVSSPEPLGTMSGVFAPGQARPEDSTHCAKGFWRAHKGRDDRLPGLVPSEAQRASRQAYYCPLLVRMMESHDIHLLAR